MSNPSFLTSVDQAKKIVAESIRLLSPVRLTLLQAAGRVLAEDVIASVDIPPFAQSSMDGYAIRFADKDLPLALRGEMAAGAETTLSINSGEAARIFTGAPLPDGADTVVMQEKVLAQEGKVLIKDEALKAGNNVRPQGADVSTSAIAVQKETLLTPAAIGFLAGIGETEVAVYPAPSVSIIVTGKELQSPGKPLSAGQVYESNSFSLRTALYQAGVNEVSVLQADDDIDVLTERLQRALSASDMILLTGGVSVGDYDFVVEATRRYGIEQRFHKVAQRPGKPLYFGMKDAKPVFGLPGNPSSVLSCFYNYVLLAIEKLSKKPVGVRTVPASLTKAINSPQGLTQFLKGKFEDGKATPLGAQESFQLSSFAQADCLICLEAERTLYNEGDEVTVMLLPQ